MASTDRTMTSGDGPHPATRALTFLLVALVLTLVASPAVGYLVGDIPILHYFICLVVIMALRSLDLPRWVHRGSVLLALVAVGYDAALDSEVLTVSDPALMVVASAAYALFLGTAIIGLRRHIVGTQKVTHDTVRGGIAIYLLMGILWLVLYQITARLDPNAFNRSWETHEMGGELLYFSFTTMTTLGYGDIVPTSQLARTLTSLQAIVGPLYLAVFIARLVSMHSAGSADEN